MKFFCIIFFFCLSLTIQAKTFKEILHLYEFQAKLYTKKHNIGEVIKVTPININKTLKTNYWWPNHWPFTVGITSTKAFWATFKKLTLLELHPITHPKFKNLIDIEGNEDATLIIADDQSNSLFLFQLSQTLDDYILLNEIPIDSPKQIELSKSNTLAVLTYNDIKLFKLSADTLTKNHKETKRINKHIQASNIISITFDKRNNLHCLTTNQIIIFNQRGHYIKTIFLKTAINDFDLSHENNIIGYNNNTNTIHLFSKKGDLITSKSSPKFKQNIPIKFSYFPPFSYVGLYNGFEGFGYNMGLDIKEFTWKSEQLSNQHTISFKTTFPANITLTLLNPNKKPIQTLLENTYLSTGHHQIKFSTPSKTENKYTVKLIGKATYSRSNTFNKVYKQKYRQP